MKYFSESIKGFLFNLLGVRNAHYIIGYLLSFGKRARLFPYVGWMMKRKAIFIHIPKCAGSTVIKSMGDKKGYRSHYSYIIYKEANYHIFNSFYKFTFVRNPWSRVFSMYSYLKNGGNGGTDIALAEQISKLTFEQFVLDFLTYEKMMNIRLLNPQYIYIYDEIEKEITVDYVGKVENFNEDFTKICMKLKIKPSFTKENSTGGDYQKHFTTQLMIDRVKELYYKDVDLFGYEYAK